MSDLRGIIEEAIAQARTRTSWNDRLAHWEKPASPTEEAKIERAASIARKIVANNQWLVGEGASIQPQGSYFNNTNVRLEADMDLRIQFPLIRTLYLDDIDPAYGDRTLGYIDAGKTFSSVLTRARAELLKELNDWFDAASIDASGNKAIAVSGLDGSRADCDLVPAFRLDYVLKGNFGNLVTLSGVSILGRDGNWTNNFPEQHHANGKAKRLRTACRYKKVVRMLKRLNYELCELGQIPQRLPGFLVESLVYAVEDAYFLVEADDRYDRALRVLDRMGELLFDDPWCAAAVEVNGIKLLFGTHQGWTVAQARGFNAAAIARMTA
jgi:hypothetical protein